jgi:hypothetical protein
MTDQKMILPNGHCSEVPPPVKNGETERRRFETKRKTEAAHMALDQLIGHKADTRAYGVVTLVVDFKDGYISGLEVVDKTTVRDLTADEYQAKTGRK